MIVLNIILLININLIIMYIFFMLIFYRKKTGYCKIKYNTLIIIVPRGIAQYRRIILKRSTIEVRCTFKY